MTQQASGRTHRLPRARAAGRRPQPIPALVVGARYASFGGRVGPTPLIPKVLTVSASHPPSLRQGEAVALMALMMSLMAMSVDAMLPALAEIGRDLGVRHANQAQLVIAALLLGMTSGQLIYGPISDSVGRKPAIYAGLAMFSAGSVLCLVATSFPLMLLGRVLQGFGAAGPRIVVVALVRDQYAGDAMARIMSLVLTTFILVPAVAPAVGQAILLVAHWRAIYGMLLALGLVTLIWFGLRQPETLPRDRRVSFSLVKIALGVRETCTHRVALGYTLAAGLLFGAFLGYISSAAQIFQGLYGVGRLFPLYFGGLALAIGGATYLNARLVMRYGMRRLAPLAVGVLGGCSALFLVIAWAASGQPPLWALVVDLGIVFFCFGMVFGNVNALAMEPLGHIAGVGSAVVGTITSMMSLVLGTLIGQAYDGTVLPLIAGFAVLGLGSLAVMRWAERGRPAPRPPVS
jgi:MFS transporter, DHA1 family, multidrug resistance protein